MSLKPAIQNAVRAYRIQRKRLSIRLLLAATSPYGLAGAGGLLGWRLHAKGIGNPYELVETAALLLGIPVLWAWGVLLRDTYRR